MATPNYRKLAKKVSVFFISHYSIVNNHYIVYAFIISILVCSCPAFADNVLLEGETKITIAPRPDDVVLQDKIRYVQKVVDGDTIIVRWNERIRLIGVDAPEVEGPYRKGAYYGEEAEKYLESLLAGKKVLIKV